MSETHGIYRSRPRGLALPLDGLVCFYVEAAGALGAPSIEHDGLPCRFWFDLEADDNRTTALPHHGAVVFLLK
jgi:hypothetical protein